MTFEAALSKLEKTIENLENEDLEQTIALYKEGVELSKYCDSILKRINADIVLLRKEGSGFREEIYGQEY
ncbi:MAG: exodeoxyribonuclease VII small subunit [Turicibacter sp.]|nr:exodeoxyribonuclease VII small subunit [Turicibacter sp.]